MKNVFDPLMSAPLKSISRPPTTGPHCQLCPHWKPKRPPLGLVSVAAQKVHGIKIDVKKVCCSDDVRPPPPIPWILTKNPTRTEMAHHVAGPAPCSRSSREL